MAFRFAALTFQKAISTSGVGLRPSLSAASGSALSTCLICLVHVMTASSSRCTRSLVVSAPAVAASSGGSGRQVSPRVRPTVMLTALRKECRRSTISLLAISPQPSWFEGLLSSGR